MPELYSEFENPTLTDESLHEFVLKRIGQHAAANPTRKAYIDASTNESLTFGEVIDHVGKVSTFLYKRGMRKGDCVMVCMRNCVYIAPLFLGSIANGGFLTGVNPAYTAHEISRQMKDSGCRFVFTEGELLDQILEASTTVYGQIKDIVVLRPPTKVLPKGVTDFVEVLRTRADPTIPSPVIDAADDVVCLPYSSGTTGVPKGVMLTHRNWTTTLKSYEINFHSGMKNVLNPPLNPEKEAQIWFLPNFHVYGFFQCNLAIYMGSTTVVLPNFDPSKFLQTIQDYKHCAADRCVSDKKPLVNKYDLTSLEMIGCGAAPLGKDLSEEFQQRFPHVKYVTQGFGMTELTLASALPVPGLGTFGHSGRTAPGFVNKIIDPATGKVLGPNERGELCVKGPCVMKGYWRRPDATKETIDSQGWLHTGDIAFYDENKCIFIVDRVKELIKVKGFQVPPAELEDLLLGHPAIADAAVIGIPDDAAGELPRAFVVLKHGLSATSTEVADFVKERVARYKQLNGGVEFVQEIPKSPSGKILRRLLKEQHINGSKSKL